MKYSIDKRENLTVLRIQEDNLNSLIAPKLKSDLIIMKNEGVPNIILDMEDIKYVDSSGLSAILTGNRMWKDDGLFVLTGVLSPVVIKLLEISKLDTVLTIKPNLQEAVEFVTANMSDHKTLSDN
jgi:anti-sigma B factor antagonist